jgi:hypothetical protein
MRVREVYEQVHLAAKATSTKQAKGLVTPCIKTGRSETRKDGGWRPIRGGERSGCREVHEQVEKDDMAAKSKAGKASQILHNTRIRQVVPL